MKVIIPGSYDPVTLGHLEIIKNTAKQYEEVFAVVFINPEKEYEFSLDERVKMLLLATEDISNVTVSYSLGMVVDYMREHSIEKIIKGYRNKTDLEYEQKQSEYNFLHGGYETELIKCNPEFEKISSTVAREAIKKNLPLDEILPKAVIEFIKNR